MFNPHLMNERDLSIRIFKWVSDLSLDSEKISIFLLLLRSILPWMNDHDQNTSKVHSFIDTLSTKRLLKRPNR